MRVWHASVSGSAVAERFGVAGRIRILSIDGGGIRGIVPAVILAEIEERTGRPVWELFDLIAGTSTGGILALGLTVPGAEGGPRYAARDLVELYERNGREIFSRSLWHKVYALGNLLEEKYPAESLENILQEYFGQARLRDALTEVLVTSYEIERRTPFFFKSRRARESEDYDFLMRQIARATSAAPTYFEPAKIERGPSDYYALVDGGVFANNPAMCGYVEARTYAEADTAHFPRGADFLALSLGTGELIRRLPYEEAKDWGIALWAQPILDVVFDGVSDTVDYQMRELLPEKDGERRYYRFQQRLEEGNDDLDDASPANIRALKLMAQEIVANNEAELDTLCGQLTR